MTQLLRKCYISLSGFSHVCVHVPWIIVIVFFIAVIVINIMYYLKWNVNKSVISLYKCFIYLAGFYFFPILQVSEARALDRDVVESDLTFAGFAVIRDFLSLVSFLISDFNHLETHSFFCPPINDSPFLRNMQLAIRAIFFCFSFVSVLFCLMFINYIPGVQLSNQSRFGYNII